MSKTARVRKTEAAKAAAPHVWWGLLSAFFLSGAAGLIFEIVWFYRASLVLGNSIWAASVVLSSFMAGIGLGNLAAGWWSRRISSPVRVYAVLETLIAVSGVAVTYLLPGITSVVVPLGTIAQSAPLLLPLARLIIAFTVLLIPAMAMGATLPLLLGAVRHSGDGLGRPFGRLYGWNTIGAVAGVISAELVLIETVGVSGAAWLAALLDLAAAAIAISTARRHVTGADWRNSSSTRAVFSARQARLLVATFLAGAAFMALEVIWFRFLSMFVLTTTLPMSLMLAVVLAGIGLGGLIASFLLGRRRQWTVAVPVLALVASCTVVLMYRGFAIATSGSQIADWRQVLWLATVLTGPTSLASGALLTAVAEAMAPEPDATVRTSGWLLVANTSGAMVGPLVAAFVLLPFLGTERALFGLGAAYIIVAMLAIGAAPSAVVSWRDTIRSRSFIVAAVAAAVVVLTFPFGLMNRYYDRVVRPYSADGSEIVAAREGPTETILLMRQRWMNQTVYDRLVTNGFSMSGTAMSAQRYMRYFAYWPMMLHAQPLERALLICYGVGITATSLTDIPSLKSIDVVEISPDVTAVSDLIYPPDRHPLHDPRVHVHLEDGRYFLQTSSERYDLITGEPPPPRTPGAVNIYTREYFQLVYERLAEGGMTTYWLPVARPDPGSDVNTIIRAFCDVFEDCSLWNATPFDFMLVGTRHAKGPVADAQFDAAWQKPRLSGRLREVGFETPEQIGATFLGDATYLRQLVASTPSLTDNFPQRLRPVVTRPSLSDPAYRVNTVVLDHYQRVLSPARARDAFARSELIRKLWPPDLVERSLPFFEPQRILNRVLWDGSRPLEQIEDLHALLTNTTLETAPLWLLGSNDVMERIAESSGGTSGPIDYVRGLFALAHRDYGNAAARLGRAASNGVEVSALRPLLAYALCLDHRVDLAREMSRTIRPGSPDEQHFWTWMGSKFDVGPLAEGTRQ